MFFIHFLCTIKTLSPAHGISRLYLKIIIFIFLYSTAVAESAFTSRPRYQLTNSVAPSHRNNAAFLLLHSPPPCLPIVAATRVAVCHCYNSVLKGRHSTEERGARGKGRGERIIVILLLKKCSTSVRGQYHSALNVISHPKNLHGKTYCSHFLIQSVMT